jgi:quercetin dioxygenase-like cupin family protein
MAGAEQKSFAHPDETRPFEKGRVDLLNIGGGTVGRLTLEPGWRWSEHVKPIAGTDWCEAPHFQYHVSGRLHVRMEDGSELDVLPGEVTALPSGHDAWVVGDEPAVVVDFFGASTYATRLEEGAGAR